MRIIVSQDQIIQALQLAAANREVDKPSKVTISAKEPLSASVAPAALSFTLAEVEVAVQDWLLRSPRNQVVVGLIEFSHVGAEWEGRVNVEQRVPAKRPRKPKAEAK